MAVPDTDCLGAAEMPTILVPTSATPLTTGIPAAGTSVIPEAQPPRRWVPSRGRRDSAGSQI